MKTPPVKIIVLIAVILSLFGSVSDSYAQDTQEPQLIFDHALDSGGMSFNGGFLQDRESFFWIATGSGFFKWDGYTLKKPEGSPDTANAAYEDREGLIWVTAPTGLSVYDKATDSFAVYKHDPKDPKSIGEGAFNWSIQPIAEDSVGNIWFGTQKGLNKYDRKAKTFTAYAHDPVNPNGLGNDNVYAVWVDKQDMVWIGTEGGLDKFDPATGAFTHYQNDPNNPRSLSNNIVQVLFEDQNGVLWVGTRDGGLDRFDKQNGTFTRYLNDPHNPRSLGNNNIFSITEARPGELWLTSTFGLDVFDTKTGIFYHYKSDSANSDSLSTNNPRNVYKDRWGAIWVIHFNGTLDKIDPYGRKFTLYRNNPQNTKSLAGNVVSSAYQDKQGVMWIGILGQGLDKLNRTTNVFTHYPDAPGGVVTYMLEDKAGTFWMTGFGGIFTFDKAAGKYSELYPIKTQVANVILLDRNDDNLLWVGTNMAGLVKFDKTTQQAVYFRHDPNNPGSLSNDAMFDLFMDKDGFIWIPTYSGGLDKFDPKTEKVVEHYRNNPDDPQSLGSDTLNHVYEDSAGRIWVGTFGSGLNRLNPDGTFTRYNEQTGFPTNVVENILEDNQGFLWLGTKIGLIKFDPKTGTSRLYTKDDGLQGNEFWQYPNYKAPDGELWVYGGGGLNSFYPDQLKDNPYKPPVYFTALTQGGEPLKGLKAATERVKEITLDWQSNFFEFEAAALNFTSPEKNQYQYILDGVDKGWYNAGTKRAGRYSGLPDGTHTLRVRGSNNDGVWSDEEAVLKVTVVEPFWRTTWFMLLVGLVAIGSVAGGVLARIRAIEARHNAAEERRRELERLVADRTSQLEAANTELEAFAYSVSHDLRAPLRHIDGFLELLQKRTATTLDEQSRHYMATISDSAKRMGALIDDLLSFSRMGRLEMSKVQVDLGALVQETIQEFEPETRGRIIRWQIADLPLITGDRAMLQVVFVNLISNALKFTRPRAQAEIEIGCLPERGKETTVFVRDNGVGFDMNYADNLFRVFQRLHRIEEFEGTGIGLANVRRIILRHGGRTWAEGKVDQGATFYFSLPQPMPGA